MIRVFVLDRGRLMCDTMTRVLGLEPDISVVGSGTRVEDLLPVLDQVDTVLLAAGLPGGLALEVTRFLADHHPSPKVVVMDITDSQEALSQYVAAGLSAYALEEDTLGTLLERMRTAHVRNDASHWLPAAPLAIGLTGTHST